MSSDSRQSHDGVPSPIRTTTPRQPINVKSLPSPTNTQQTNAVLTNAFDDDPVFRYLLNHLDERKQSIARQRIFTLLMKLAEIEGGIFFEASSASTKNEQSTSNDQPQVQCAAFVTKPQKHLNEVGPGAFIRVAHKGIIPVLKAVGVTRFPIMQTAYGTVITGAQKKYFSRKTNPKLPASFKHPEDFYYVDFIGTDAAHRGKGLASAVMKELQEVARKDVDSEGRGKPIWIEASTEQSRKVYAKCGFKDVQSLYLGKGKCDRDGRPAKGDDAIGVEWYGLVWWPEGLWPGETETKDL